MISIEEIEVLTKQKLSKSIVSIQQINKATIRINLLNHSFVDVFQSFRDATKFAFHAKVSGGKIYRLDCRPEKKYQKLMTFPWHFHKGSEDNIVVSPFSTNKRRAVIQFFKFIKTTLSSPKP